MTVAAIMGTLSSGVASPDPFTLNFAGSPYAPHATATSDTITVSGLGTGISVTAATTLGTIVKNGVDTLSSSASVTNGDTVVVKLTMPASAIRLAKTSGSWTTAVTRIDYQRDVPYDTNSGSGLFEVNFPAYANMFLYDYNSIESARGMPLAPAMGTGLTVTG